MLSAVASPDVHAQTTADYEGLTYYLNKEEAFDAAGAQGKLVFLFWGSDACRRCGRVRVSLADESLRSLLDEHYILWYADATVYDRYAPEVTDYLSSVESPYVYYPALCVIDPSDIKKAQGLVWGQERTASQLSAMLTRYVANEALNKPSSRAYVSQKRLTVESDAEREKITVYAVTGAQADQFDKIGQVFTRDASSYPSGILIIAGSSGWARKIVVRRD